MNKDLLLQRLSGVPFNDYLGMEIVEIEEGKALMRIRHRPEFIGDRVRPSIHGGLISALADMAGGLAVMTSIGNDMTTSTVDLRVDYLRPGAVDQDLYARSEPIRMGNRVAATQTLVYQDDPDKPIAMATGVYSVVRRRPPRTDAPADDDDGSPRN